MKIVQTIPIDKKTRVVIGKDFQRGRWGYWVAIQKRFLWMWMTSEIVNDMWDRVNGYDKEDAERKAEKIKSSYLDKSI
jgi:hypothetical protein